MGLPLFPGSSEYNQMSRIVETLGVLPNHMIEKGKHSRNFFTRVFNPDPSVKQYALKTMQQYQTDQKTVEQPSKRYIQGITLEEMVIKHEGSKKNAVLTEEKRLEDRHVRMVFIDFLQGLLNLSPLERWSPQQARLHPFITGAPWTGPFDPNSVLAAAQAQALAQKQMTHIDTVMSDMSYTNSPTAATSTASFDTSVISTPIAANRSTRQRASTLSSSNVTTVPPTLQRLVQQTGGPSPGGRGLKHREKEKNEEVDVTEPVASSPTNKREIADEDGATDGKIRGVKSGRFSSYNKRSDYKPGDVIFSSKGAPIQIPPLQIPTNNFMSHLNMSPTAAMMNSPINRNQQHSFLSARPSDSKGNSQFGGPKSPSTMSQFGGPKSPSTMSQYGPKSPSTLSQYAPKSPSSMSQFAPKSPSTIVSDSQIPPFQKISPRLYAQPSRPPVNSTRQQYPGSLNSISTFNLNATSGPHSSPHTRQVLNSFDSIQVFEADGTRAVSNKPDISNIVTSADLYGKSPNRALSRVDEEVNWGWKEAVPSASKKDDGSSDEMEITWPDNNGIFLLILEEIYNIDAKGELITDPKGYVRTRRFSAPFLKKET